ncbi:hypothetical protein [Aneurinibacillus thermoaerophilus]|uniref:hypothetical protein n=1 Tax=Aneurinibacillus thermoaerophilus TaxID=143495 RepID=UPI002E21791C|nr:hypothetical protein [Aneurinibacillus thermoaerophilus]
MNPEILLQVAILGLFEDRGMNPREVMELSRKTTIDVWHSLIAEKREDEEK